MILLWLFLAYAFLVSAVLPFKMAWENTCLLPIVIFEMAVIIIFVIITFIIKKGKKNLFEDKSCFHELYREAIKRSKKELSKDRSRTIMLRESKGEFADEYRSLSFELNSVTSKIRSIDMIPEKYCTRSCIDYVIDAMEKRTVGNVDEALRRYNKKVSDEGVLADIEYEQFLAADAVKDAENALRDARAIYYDRGTLEAKLAVERCEMELDMAKKRVDELFRKWQSAMRCIVSSNS